MMAVPKMSCLQIPGVGFNKGTRRGTGKARPLGNLFDAALPNTWQIDGRFVRFDAVRCAFNKLPISIGKSAFSRVATPLGFEPRITPPKGAVLPLHHGVFGYAILDSRFSI